MHSISISKSVGRTFEVLEYFRSARVPCTMGALGHALRYPSSSMRVILKSLANLGYLAYDSKKKTYFPTPRVMGLGDWVENALLDSPSLTKVLDSVQLRTEETTALVIPSFIFCNLFQVHNGTRPMSLALPKGIGLPLINSAAGRILLSQMSESDIEGIIEHTRYWVGHTRAPIRTDHDVVLRSVELARKNGYLVDHGCFMKDVITVAYVVPSPFPTYPIALLVSGPTSRIKGKEQKIHATIRLSVNNYCSDLGPCTRH